MVSSADEIAELRRENAQLRAELRAALAIIEQQRVLLEELRRQLDAQTQLLARQNEQLTELLALARRKQRKESPPAAPASAPTLTGEAAGRFADRPLPPAKPEPKKPEPKPKKPTGRKPVPEHLVTDEHTVHPVVCACGCGEFDVVGEVTEEKLHVVQEHQRRRLVRRKVGRCRSCGTRVTARSLPAPYSRSKVTCAWLAWLLHSKFVLLLPLDRIRRDLASRGIPLSMGTLVSLVQRAADQLSDIDGAQWKELQSGGWMQTDGSGLKVLVRGLPAAHNGHLEVYTRDGQVVFQYEAGKDGETQASKLGGFVGTLLADAEHRYNATFASGRVVEAGCNAHGYRRFEAAEQVQPVLAKEGGGFIGAMFAADAEARQLGLTGDELGAWRQQRCGPLRDQLRAWMDAVEPTLLPSDKLAEAIRYYRNHWDALFRFIEDPRLPLDNSAAEREFQHLAKLRWNVLFAGSSEGAHAMAVLLGLARTCINLKVDPQAYFAWALERRGTHQADHGLRAADLTPAAYRAATAGGSS